MANEGGTKIEGVGGDVGARDVAGRDVTQNIGTDAVALVGAMKGFLQTDNKSDLIIFEKITNFYDSLITHRDMVIHRQDLVIDRQQQQAEKLIDRNRILELEGVEWRKNWQEALDQFYLLENQMRNKDKDILRLKDQVNEIKEEVANYKQQLKECRDATTKQMKDLQNLMRDLSHPKENKEKLE